MRRLVTAVLASTLLTACGGDSFSPEDVSGTAHVLQSINGTSLPFSKDRTDRLGQTFTVTITDGAIGLNATSTFSMFMTTRLERVGGSHTVTERETNSGTFELVKPATLRFRTASGHEFSGILDGNRLTIVGVNILLVESTDTFVFSK